MTTTNNPIAEISRQELKDLDTPSSATITDVQHLASYNWIEAPKATPTIAIPGSPDLWSPPNRPFKLDKDKGLVYIAQNAARHPDSPLEPLFRALYASHPSFNIAAMDIISDRNNIRKLLGLINPRWDNSKREDFTIHIETKNNTAIFRREEARTHEYIGPHDFRGYGHSFEKKCTRHQVPGSTGHHRVLSYAFGGMNFLIRHETDGYIGTQSSVGTPVCKIDDISSVLDALSLSPENNRVENMESAGCFKLVVKREGRVVPLGSTIEIKTRAAHRPLAFEDVVAQLWVSQTPGLVRAYHTKGFFSVPRVEDVGGQVRAWEDENQKDLGMLAGLIGRIREVVGENGGRAELKYDSRGDRLVFYALEGKKMLPEDLYAKWDGKASDE